LRVVDMAGILWLVGRIQAIQHTVRFPGNREGADGHALELAHGRRRHIGAELLDLQLRLDAGLFERALHQLRNINMVGPRPLVTWSCVLNPLETPASASRRRASFRSY